MREWFSDSERNEASKLKQVWAAIHNAVFARFLQWLVALPDKWGKSVNCGRTGVCCLGYRTYSNCGKPDSTYETRTPISKFDNMVRSRNYMQ